VNRGKTLFAQLMDFLPWSTFTRIVARYGGDQGVRTLSCAEHYRAMAFAQLTYRESLRDIETCFSVQASKLYSMDPEHLRRIRFSEAETGCAATRPSSSPAGGCPTAGPICARSRRRVLPVSSQFKSDTPVAWAPTE
jgi:hypothetical protein